MALRRRTPEPEEVNAELQEAIGAEVRAEVRGHMRRYVHRQWATYAVLAFLGVLNLYTEQRAADKLRVETLQRAAQLRGEARTRVGQICAGDEREHLLAVRRYRNVLRYLIALPAAERTQGINRAVVQQLPQTRQEAVTDSAPPFCDGPNVGLPEPDPVLPKDPFAKGPQGREGRSGK